jgi:hypothetical protein
MGDRNSVVQFIFGMSVICFVNDKFKIAWKIIWLGGDALALWQC